MGSATNQLGGYYGIQALVNGNYILKSAGNVTSGLKAVTFCAGNAVCRGAVSISNSLVCTGSREGAKNLVLLPDNNYLIVTPN